MKKSPPRFCTYSARGWATALALSLAAAGTALGQPGSLDLTFDPGLGADAGIVTVAAQSDGKLVIGGKFTSFNGTNQGGLARLNPDGSLDPSFNIGTGANRGVSNIIVLADDRLMVSGGFSSINGVSRYYIARLNADGTLDTNFNAAFTNYDSTLTVQSDGRIVAAYVQPQQKSFAVYRLNADGSFDRSFNYFASGAANGGSGGNVSVIYGKAQADDRLIVGGDLLVRLLANGSRDTSFVYRQADIFTFPRTTALVVQNDGRILTAGTFTKLADVTRNYLARLNTDGTLDATFDPGPGPGSPPRAIALQPDGKLLVVGSFTSFAGSARSRIARLNSDGSLDSSFDPGSGPDYNVNSLLLTTNGQIIIVGDFTNVNGMPRSRIARLNTDASAAPAIVTSSADQNAFAGRSAFLFANLAGSQPLSYQWQLNGTNVDGGTNAVLNLSNVHLTNAGAYTLVVTNSQGSTTSTGINLAVSRAPVRPGSPDAAAYAGAGADSVVRALSAGPNGKVVIAGMFAHVNGVVRSRVAQLNPNGSLDPVFDPGAGPNDQVYAAAFQPDGKLIIGGAFTNVSGAVRRCVARLNTNGSLDASFNPNPGVTQVGGVAAVYALAVESDGRVLIGGAFDRVNNTTRLKLARLLPDGSLDSGFNPAPGATVVYSLLVQPDGKILAGGYKSNLGTAFLARYYTDATPDGSFSAALPPGDFAYSLALQPDGQILVAGQMNYGVVRLSPRGGRDTSFNLGWSVQNWTPQAIALQADGRVIVVGTFTNFNGFERRHVARLNTDGTMDTSFDPGASADGVVRAVALSPTGAALIGGEFASVDGCPRNGFARLNGDARILSSRLADDGFHASVQTDLGKNYTLQFRDSLDSGDWLSLPSVPGDATIKDLTDSATVGPQRFYRVLVE